MITAKRVGEGFGQMAHRLCIACAPMGFMFSILRRHFIGPPDCQGLKCLSVCLRGMTRSGRFAASGTHLVKETVYDGAGG
jgi:hypothetical protein